MFRILQWADSHLNASGVNATQKLIPSVPNIDFTVHCGDVTKSQFSDGIGTYDGAKSACVIGNHDAVISGFGNIDWTQQVSQQQIYDRYLSKSKTVLNLDMNVNETWWSKKVAPRNLLILGLNDTTTGEALENQMNWLDRKLAEAENEKLDVVVAKHGPTIYENIEKCNFSSAYMTSAGFSTDKSDYAKWYPNGEKMMNKIASSAANIVCVLCGHEHGDGFGIIIKQDGKRIPMIHIGSTLVDEYNDVPRTTDTNRTASVVCNLIEYSDECKSLRVYRLGADSSKNGSLRKLLVYSYEAEDIVAACTNGQ
jgi:hypothetical protein